MKRQRHYQPSSNEPQFVAPTDAMQLYVYTHFVGLVCVPDYLTWWTDSAV